MLLERTRELGLMADLLASAESSGGKVVLVRGEAGIGKSALVSEFLERHRDSAHIHIGSCDDLLTPQPLGPFWDVARNEPSLAEPLEQGDRRGALAATMDLLGRSLRPNVLAIEDTHWADGATLDAIKYLGRRIEGTNALLVLTYRDGEVDHDHPLRGVIGDLPPPSVVRIRLSGLSLSGVASIVADTDLDADEVLAATDGNPVLVGQMASTGGGAVPPSVQDVVLARMRKLSPEARETAKTFSVIPQRIRWPEVLGLTEGDDGHLAECQRYDLLDIRDDSVGFCHEITRRAVEASLSRNERVAINRRVLELLPPTTDPARLVHHARQADDTNRVLQLAPEAARAAAALGSHREAVDHFRLLTALLDRIAPNVKGSILGEWATEEFLVGNISDALDLDELTVRHYTDCGDRRAESRALCQAARHYEFAGQRRQAEELASRAVEVLGTDPGGSDLAGALEVNAYLAGMADDFPAALDLIDRTLEAAGPDIEERVLIRCLDMKGWVANKTHYPDGRPFYEEGRDRAETAGLWYDECRALCNHAWDAILNRDLPIASDLAQQAIASALRNELLGLESYTKATYATVLELQGEWSHAEDLARDQLEHAGIAEMVALTTVGVIEARTGRDGARSTLLRAWKLARTSAEFQRLAPTAIALAELAWISGSTDVPVGELRDVLTAGSTAGRPWYLGSLAFWLWKLGELPALAGAIADPYRLVIEGDPVMAAAMWSTIGCPYERAIALAHGDQSAQLKALEALDELGAAAVAAKLRKSLRDQGVAVPRGKARTTREHAAGLTSRQAEVLDLLGEGLTNIEIADRLFVSPRTIEHHVSAVLAKLDCSTREEAVSRARSDGLLDR